MIALADPIVPCDHRNSSTPCSRRILSCPAFASQSPIPVPLFTCQHISKCPSTVATTTFGVEPAADQVPVWPDDAHSAEHGLPHPEQPIELHDPSVSLRTHVRPVVLDNTTALCLYPLSPCALCLWNVSLLFLPFPWLSFLSCPLLHLVLIMHNCSYVLLDKTTKSFQPQISGGDAATSEG